MPTGAAENTQLENSTSKNGNTRTVDEDVQFTVDSLHNALRSRGYICDRSRVRSVYAALMSTPIGGMFAFGKPGTGKTWLLELLADILGTSCYFQQVSPGTREEELIQDLLPDEEKQSGIRKELGVLPKAVLSSQEEPTFLILDEWDKTRPTADSFLLDFLQNGRINYGDLNIQADMDNLYVGITLNDERDLNGPLHRRLPYLHFEPLHPSLVRQALIDSHGKHSYIEACVNLYVRCELSQMDKACTIQELRNLLDAISVLGDEADWNELVFDHVTKGKQNHELLKQSESLDVEDWEEDDVRALDPSNYGEVDDDGEITPERVGMPEIADTKGYTTRTDNDRAADLSGAFAAFQKSDTVYNELTRLEEPGEEPDHFGRVHVEGETITFDEPVPLSEYDKWNRLMGKSGEIVFIEERATKEDIFLLRDERGLEITSYTEEEIIGRKGDIHVRWTEESGAEIIVPTDEPSEFTNLLVGSWLHDTDKDTAYTFDIPTRALMRIGGDSVGQVAARWSNYETADPYFSGVFDEWMQDEVDYATDAEIFGYEEFMEHAQENAEDIIIEGSSIYVFFENVMIGFIGEENDYFAVSVTGPFGETIAKHLREWLPGSRLFLKRQIEVDKSEKTLIDEHGFEVTTPSDRRTNPRRMLKRIKEGTKVMYRDGVANIGAQLIDEKISRKRSAYVMQSIDKAVKELSA
jgi:MoxR-like ATPase